MRPHAVALRYQGADLTWADLDRRTDELAAGLAGLGVGVGDRVAVLLLNCVEYVELSVACWKLGAALVPLNVRFTAPEVAFVVDHAGCRLVVTEPSLAAATSAIEAQDRVLLVDDLARLRVAGGRPAPDAAGNTVGGDDAATICYTSGTTGTPKGAVLTHASWNFASQGWSQATLLNVNDRVLLPFPLAFTGGFAVFLFTYWTGARLVLERGFEAEHAIDILEAERITALFAVPVIHQQLTEQPRWATADLSAYRLACSGGAPVPEHLIRAVQARGVPMLQGFSLTEGSAGVTVLPGEDALRKLGSAGLPVVHCRIGVVDEDDQPRPPGEIGEIVMAGPQVMREYWRDPEGTADALRGGWLHTGDLGRIDDEGYLYVVDRAKDMLISGGLNVYPAELERVLAAVPHLVEVAVIGVPDDKWGETPAVIAVTDGAPLDGEDVLGVCRGVLADYKLPRYLVVRDEALPRNMSGKILKRELRETYADLPQHATPIR
jgi:fatty-acyl-CoA synthase